MIKFTLHAEVRIKERGTTKKQVIEAVETPEFILPGRGDRQIAIKQFEEKFLKVVFEKSENDIIYSFNSSLTLSLKIMYPKYLFEVVN